MIKKNIILLFVTVVCLTYTAASQNRETQKATEKTTEALAKKCKGRIIASPIFFYTPETRFAFGGAGSYIFQLAGCDKNARPSSISPVVIYTLEKQFISQLKTELYFKNNNYRLLTEIGFLKFPNKFYGIGSSTREESEEAYTSRTTQLLISLLKKINNDFNIGVQYQFADWDITEVEETGLLGSGAIPGVEGGTLSGISLLLNRDTRDNIFSPGRGDLFEFNLTTYPKFLGSTFEFTTFTLDLRKYFPVFSSHVFAVQSLAVIQTGDVPFLYMAQMGGPYIMRGYFEGRFRDKSLLVFQAEYRMPLFWRLGAVGFVSMGNVAEKFSQLDFGTLKSTYGIGLRFLFDKKERIQLRMDIGWGKNSSGFYISIFEAF